MTAPKGKSHANNPTKGPIKDPSHMEPSKGSQKLKWHQCANSTTSTACGGVITNWSQLEVKTCCLTKEPTAELVNPNSLAVVMKEMKDDALANGTMEPTLDKIEAEYQCRIALRCSAGLQLPPFIIRATSSIISNALNASGQSQLTEASDHQSAGITNATASHSGSLSLTGLTKHGNCSQNVLSQLAQPIK